MLTHRWQPLAEIKQLRNEMDRLFGRYGVGNREGLAVFPELNIGENDDKLFVEAELPGFRLNDLEMYVTGENQLSIKGERKQPEMKDGTWHRQERGFGSFSRTVELPHAVDRDNVTAEFDNGVLTITLPKCEAAKPRRITVKAK